MMTKQYVRVLSWCVVLAVVITVSIIKLHLLDIPLERDEGEYAYIAQLLMQGEPLYASAYSMKLPAIYFVYAAVMALFGQTPYGIHMGLLVITAVTIVLVFLLARRMFGSYAGVMAAIAFALLTLGKYTLAFNIEPLVMLLVLSGSLIMLSLIGRGGGLLLSGFVFGLAFVAKQHAVFFILFGAFYVLWNDIRIRPIPAARALKRVSLFLVGSTVPFLLVCLYIYACGSFGDFWFWIFKYASKYCSFITFSDGVESFMYVSGKIIGSSPLVWALSGIGLFAGVWSALERDKAVFICGLFVASFLAITPGLYFRHHYFIFLFPALALFAGIAIRYVSQYLSQRGITGVKLNMIMTGIFILFFSISIFQQKNFLFRMDPIEACRDIYNMGPFTESVELARYIENNSGKNSRVIVLGSEPQIYFYLRKIAPVKYIYMYPLLEETPYALAMQASFIKEVESAASEYLICVNVGTSWFNGYVNPDKAKPLFDWVNTYPRKFYEVAGAVDMVSRDRSVYVWGPEAKDYRLKGEQYIIIFKRKAGIETVV
ncbi:MAG: glycosyltransferase family 39 protein [Candidatus Omnitrophica bacterium]|nr:glycosyltransferase family 39 protein [Candidatus Omnitrophota bacterium]